ncbi:MAG: hypothetical protein DMF68_15325 [Acidobacteria bacterium]|nr:MAG: hypothetical protein DMF68_15325 [Acidobacteriota bacterium]
MKADDEIARLDNFALALSKDANLRGYIVGYGEQRLPPGDFLRRIYGYLDYLVNRRGVDPNLIKVVEGGNKEKMSAELWLAPKGAPPPHPISKMEVRPTSPLKFDEITFGIGCESEMSVYLENVNDGLRFFARALRGNPQSQGLIIIYPKWREHLSRAANIARHTKNLLIRNYNIEANRLVAKVGKRRRDCAKSELWVVPTSSTMKLNPLTSRWQ